MTDVPPSSTPSPAVPDAVLAELARLAEPLPPGPYKAGVDVFDPDDGIVATVTDKPIGLLVEIGTEVFPVDQADWARAQETPAYRAALYFAACDPTTIRALVAELAARRAADAGRSEP